MSQQSNHRIDAYTGKIIAAYDNAVGSIYRRQLEFEKQLLILASLAIGLLVGLLEPTRVIEFRVWLSACISFAYCIIALLVVFYNSIFYFVETANSLVAEGSEKDKHIEEVNYADKITVRLMTTVYIVFAIGTILTIILGYMKFAPKCPCGLA